LEEARQRQEAATAVQNRFQNRSRSPEIQPEIEPDVRPEQSSRVWLQKLPVAESSRDAERRAAGRMKREQHKSVDSDEKPNLSLIEDWQDALIKAQQEICQHAVPQTAAVEAAVVESDVPDVPSISVAPVELPSDTRAPQSYQCSSFCYPSDALPQDYMYPEDVEYSAHTLQAISSYLDDDLKAKLRSEVMEMEVEDQAAGVPAFRPEMLTEADRGSYHDISIQTEDRVYFTVDNCDFMLRDVEKLLPGEWLNDNIINCYMKLLQLRDGQLEGGPSCHFCKTYLINHIFPDYDYSSVRRWTMEKKLRNWGQVKSSILKCDFIFFPVNQCNLHWILVVADLRHSVIRLYDSMGAHRSRNSSDEILLQNIVQYLVDEAVDKLGEQWSADAFTFEFVEMPQQTNSSDCGVYAARTAKELSVQNALRYTPEEMQDYRILILKELSLGHLL